MAIVATLLCVLPTAVLADDLKVERDSKQDAKARIEDLHQRLSGRISTGDAEAMTQMATLKEQGDEVYSIDIDAAYALYEQAAGRGDKGAVKKMCIAYLLGQGRPKDVVRASGFCNKVDPTDAVTLFWGGYDYQFGVSGPKDIESAKAAYQQAFLNGSGDAADAIGRMAYDGGHMEAARSWYRRGASMGSAGAMAHLAAMVGTGQAGEKDTVEAGWLYGLAAKRGNVEAQAWMKAHPAPAVARMAMGVDKAETAFTHTYGPAGKEQTETLTSSRISLLMRTSLKDNMLDGGGLSPLYFAYFDCYVRADHQVDVCVTTREFPLNVGIDKVMHAVWDGRVSAPDRDVAGNPTAQTYFSAGFVLYFENE